MKLISIFEFCETANNNGYGVALLDENGKCITPYVDPSDYPDVMLLDKSSSHPQNETSIPVTYSFCSHAGIFETNPDFLERT